MKPVVKIVFIWLAWALILLGYQSFVQMRFQPNRPDRSLSWTPDSTQANSNQGKIYLNDPFMNSQVAWDSEYYLSIATVGYDDPAVQGIKPDFNWGNLHFCVPGAPPACYSRNYAFFPFYPYVSRVLAFPLHALPLTPIAASTLASVLVSLLGTLGAALALYELTRDELGEEGGMRAVFYLLIFPSAFFLAQVYTEGLFVGLAFGSLAFLKRRQWVLAGLLAGFATWTRAAGGLLVVPLALTWLADVFGYGKGPLEPGDSRLEVARSNLDWRSLVGLVFVFAPAAAYELWNNTLGVPFKLVETLYFSRGILLIPQSLQAWTDAIKAFASSNLQARAYYTVEFAAIILAVLACALTFKRYPWISLFGALVIFFSFFSGVAQGMHRYVLAVPSIFILLARWGKNEAFNRSWTVASILTMGLMAAMYSFDFWAG